MLFVLWSEAFDDRNRICNRWLANVHRLEPSLEGCILFDVLAIFIDGCRTDALELSAGEGWLEEIRCIQRSLGCTSANNGMKLIDEKNDLSRRVTDRIDDALQPLFKLSTKFCPSNQRTEIKG